VKRLYLATVGRLSTDRPSPSVRQLPISVVYAVASLIAVIFGQSMITNGTVFILGAVVMTISTFLALYYTKRRQHNRWWALLVPGTALLAIALLRASTGGGQSVFGVLLILPIIWIAAERGHRWILVSIAGVTAALILPYVIDGTVPASSGEWMRVVFSPFIFGVAATIINEFSRQGRGKLMEVRALALQRQQLLEVSTLASEALVANEARLRAADRLTRSVLDAVTEQSVIGTDLVGLVDVWNPGASFMLGLAPDETQGIRYIYDFHLASELAERSRELDFPHGATVLNPGFSALVESARLGQAEVRDWTYVRADGTELTVSVAVTPRADEDGATIGYIFVGTDVTQALEVSRMKDEFVGLISHELRTPLSSILGYLELMRDEDEDPLSDDQLKYLAVAERNAHRLLRLVGDLLFTAQVASGKFPLEITEVQLHDVVHAAVQSAGPVASAAGVTLGLEVTDDMITVRGDTQRLGQSFDNLISNAIKFTPRGGSVTVSLGHEHDEAIVTVRDTGMGIPASEIDQLYARFFRASTATRNAVPGVGLGLTITKAIVTAHAGRLDVESEEGIGTAFSLSLPLSVPSAVRSSAEWERESA
jgi:signal transduction histidine kinase